MLLKTYTKECFRSKCQSGAERIHCYAHLEEDVSEALPYLNSTLGGFSYTKEPPSVTFKVHGKLITVHSKKIAVNALQDEEEAEKIVSWLQREINEAWEKRDTITPSYTGMPRPALIEILKLLPKTNCRKCGEPTCMVFAVRVTEGVKDDRNCPEMNDTDRNDLKNYLSQFELE